MIARTNHTNYNMYLTMAAALALLGIFIGWNYVLNDRSMHEIPDQHGFNERERIPDTAGLTARRLAYHDFESGSAADTAAHLSTFGHSGRQSLEMSRSLPFSPGLWIRFRDLNPRGSCWIRATGYVWFSCEPAEARCSLVVTCNHNGINYKYMHVPVEMEPLKVKHWNRISIDYQIPVPPDREDVLQAYFWYRGTGALWVDDIDIEYYTQAHDHMTQ